MPANVQNNEINAELRDQDEKRLAVQYLEFDDFTENITFNVRRVGLFSELQKSQLAPTLSELLTSLVQERWSCESSTNCVWITVSKRKNTCRQQKHTSENKSKKSRKNTDKVNGSSGRSS
jgi:NH3-dependent NAD+ synthetase